MPARATAIRHMDVEEHTESPVWDVSQQCMVPISDPKQLRGNVWNY